MLLASGQHFICDRVSAYSGLYVGLMINSGTIPESGQLGSALPDLVEISTYSTCSGYTRQELTSWTKTGTDDPIIASNQITWTASGTWQQVNGYFIAVGSVTGVYDAIAATVFPVGYRGDRSSTNNDIILLRAIYEQKDDSE